MRVLDTRIPPSGATPLHTHRWPSVLHAISWSPFVRRDAKGNVTVDSRTIPQLPAPPSALRSPPLAAHSLEDVGQVEIRVISVELKEGAISAKPQESRAVPPGAA